MCNQQLNLAVVLEIEVASKRGEGRIIKLLMILMKTSVVRGEKLYGIIKL